MSDAFGNRGYSAKRVCPNQLGFKTSAQLAVTASDPARNRRSGPFQTSFLLTGNFLKKSILARLKHHFWRIFWLEKMLLYLLSKLIKEDHFACKTTRMSEF